MIKLLYQKGQIEYMLEANKQAQLMDGVEINRENPTTFQIPSAEEKAQLKVDQYIKVGAYTGAEDSMPKAERFWCQVSQINDDGTIIGTINNDLVLSQFHNLFDGDRILIEPKNILSIYE